MNKRTADYIADQLADQILSGAIRGGTPLKQEELSRIENPCARGVADH